jgi:hypothetical protein
LHTFASLAFDARDAWNHLLGAEEVLIRGGFTWEVVFGDNLSRLDGFRVLVVAGQSYLSDQECDALAEFARTDGALVLVGENGQMDEHGRQRAQPGLQKLSGERVVRVSADSARSPVAAGYEIRVPLPKQWRKLVEAIETAAKGQLSMRLSGSDTATLSGYLADSGRGIAHLVNYGAPKPQQALRLQLGPRWKTARRARILDLDGPERELAVDRTGAGGVIELPPLTTYAVVVVER